MLASCTSKTTENQPISMPEQTVKPQVEERQKPDEVSYSNVTFTTLDGNEVKIGDYEGKRVLLNLWATWCGPCVAEMPSLNNAYKALKDDNYVFLLASNEKVGKINGFANRTNYDFQFVKADDMFRPFNVRSIPTTFVFDTEGKLAISHVGAIAWDEADILKQLRAVK